jgi:hypothetical protein
MSTVELPDPPPDAQAAEPVGDHRRWRRRAAAVLTALAALLVVVVLVAPSGYGRLTPAGFLRVPVEALLGVGLILVVPARARTAVATLVGLAVGLLAIMRVFDLGFYAVLARPFDPVLDWPFLSSGLVFLGRSYGRAGPTVVLIVAIVLAMLLLAAVTLAVRRLSRLVLRHRVVAVRATAALAVVWVACALVGVHVARDVPVAARDGYERLAQVRAAVADRQAFAAEVATDAFRDTPGPELLTGLRGKDVVLVLIESYGRVAFDDPVLAARLVPLLDAGNRRLTAAGFRSKTGLLTSPTAGGGSWLAQTTLRSGVWVDNQQRYRDLPGTGRLTLNGAFRRAGWRTVAIMPGITEAWPEGATFGYDKIYDSGGLGYRGPRFAFSTMPDQYTMAAFERLERAAPDRSPVMAEIPLISSHAPWSPVPVFLDWDKLGDGRVYTETTGAGDDPRSVWTRGLDRVRADYANAIEYSLTTLISYVERYGDDDLVFVFLGDHQPAAVLTGDAASRDVPITIVTRDQGVLDQISGWGWSDGLRPGPGAPVWPMNEFRDRFLTAFGPSAAPAVAAPTGSPR